MNPCLLCLRVCLPSPGCRSVEMVVSGEYQVRPQPALASGATAAACAAIAKLLAELPGGDRTQVSDSISNFFISQAADYKRYTATVCSRMGACCDHGPAAGVRGHV